MARQLGRRIEQRQFVCSLKIFAYVVPDNGAAMTQSPPRLTLEWLMPQELGA